RFNVALLGRQVWRLINCKETLCYGVLSAKYFPDGDIFHPKRVNNPSFTWQSINKAACLLYEGFGWNVGNGSKIDLKKEHWGFEGLSGDSICIDREKVHEKMVCDLMNISKDSWNESRIKEIYGNCLGDHICKIPFLPNGPEDERIWFHNPMGLYTAKSAYSWMILKHVGFGPHRLLWKLIWKLQTLPKIRIFCWRLGHDIIPTYEKISNIRRDVNSLCPRCGMDKETLIHVLKDCPKARAVLAYGGLNKKLLDGSYDRCVDWIEDVARILDRKAFSDFITTLWNIWNSRNNRVFREVEEDAKIIWDKAASLSRDFRIFNLLEKPMIPKPVVEKGWQKPGLGTLKINFDDSVHDKKTYYDLVARDSNGFVHGGCVGCVNKDLNAEWAEVQALEESINFARLNN
ncbi:hypothetical protein Golax_022903, partial [Gossypium laxum]|nr:hypothetical protein [Gossypium laxum]